MQSEIFMIKITSLNKIYKSKKRKRCHALNDVNLTLPDTGLVFVLGKSGSGKSTLLNMIGGLDNITSGSIEIDGNDLSKFHERDFCNYRNTHLGFIFQDYHLIEELTVYDNIAFALNLRHMDDRKQVLAALARVNLSGYAERYPAELSGGEQQRVAIARAIVKKPRIILADEPTGNLDTKTARAILELLKELSKECLILIVSHNINDANHYADRIIELQKGKIICDRSRNPEFPDEVIFSDEKLIYPENTNLSAKDVALINHHKNADLIIKTDKFLPTDKEQKEFSKVKIEKKNLTFKKTFQLSGKFLRNKMTVISLSAFMVAVIMVIMSLAQTIISFDGGEVIKAEMSKSHQSSLFVRKLPAGGNQLNSSGNYHVALEDDDIQAFYDAGYKGKIYQGVTYSIPIDNFSNLLGLQDVDFKSSIYIRQTLATLIVDEEFLENKFGELNYCARKNVFHPQGVIITDYIADAILLRQSNYLLKDYAYLVQYGYSRNGQSDDILPINGIIETGYQETHKKLFDRLSQNQSLNIKNLSEDPDFQSFLADIHDRLGYSYSLNPEFTEEYLASESFRYPGFFRLVFNDTLELSNTDFRIKHHNDNGSKQSDYHLNWRYTEKPPTIPEGAKYIRLTSYPGSLSTFTSQHYDTTQNYPILVFDHGEPVSKEHFFCEKGYMLTANGDLRKQTGTYVSDYIEIPENATITEFLAFAVKNLAYCSFYDADKNYLSSEIAHSLPADNEKTIILPVAAYAKLFPEIVEEADDEWLAQFVPQKMKLSHYAFWDVNKESPLFEQEVTVDLYRENTILVSDDLFSLFFKDSIFPHSLYFEGMDGIESVLDTAEERIFEPKSHMVEGIYTMTKAVDVFIPIFELIAIILYVGVIFILVNFSSKMINDKMHEIGILKALGTKNRTISFIFGSQVLLIALLTCVLSTAGYFFFIDLANDILIKSLHRLAPSKVVLDLKFLIFDPSIAAVNCGAVIFLSLISLIVPMIKIKAIKPVKIIKAKE